MRWHRDVIKPEGKPTKKRAPQWEEWEERLLVSGYYAGLSWEDIAKSTTGRSLNGCRYHWDDYFHSANQDEPWTSEEVALIADLRREGNDWDEISKELPGHTTNACRTQWYKETESIQGPSNHQGNNDTWSAEEQGVLISLYNTIGPRWEEIRKHIPGRTETACRSFFKIKCWKEHGVGGPPSEYWEEFFMSKLHPRSPHSPRCFKLIP